MKSKITKIQILKKAMLLVLMLAILLPNSIYAVEGLTLQASTALEKLMYGEIGSAVRRMEEYFKLNSTLYIGNEIQLRALAEYVNSGKNCYGKQIILSNDIELNEEDDWIPIGTEANPFAGTFDGKENTITNLKYTNYYNYGYEDIGLFGVVAKEGTIQNVTVEDSDIRNTDSITSYYYVGNIVGYNYGTVKNCNATKMPLGIATTSDGLGNKDNRYIGLLIGYNEGTIEETSIKDLFLWGIFSQETMRDKVDLNLDGVIDLKDIDILEKYIQEKEKEEEYKILIENIKKYGNVDGKNKIDASDEKYLRDKIEEIKKYDFNGDGKTDSTDCDLLENYISGIGDIRSLILGRGDVDGNGSINSSDVTLLRNVLNIIGNYDYNGNGVTNSTDYNLLKQYIDFNNNKVKIEANCDLNGDYKVNSYDQVLFIQYYNQIKNCDFNSDGKVNGSDISLFDAYLLNGNVSSSVKDKIIANGDINGDGVPNRTDSSLMNTAISKVLKFDINGNGYFDSKDEAIVTEYLNGINMSSSIVNKIKVDGDLTRNGTIDSSDLNTLNRYVSIMSNCDVTGNGVVNSEDANLLEQYINGQLNLESMGQDIENKIKKNGDAKKDGSINSNDVEYIEKLITTLKNCDFNKDGKTNTEDCDILKSYLAGELKWEEIEEDIKNRIEQSGDLNFDEKIDEMDVDYFKKMFINVQIYKKVNDKYENITDGNQNLNVGNIVKIVFKIYKDQIKVTENEETELVDITTTTEKEKYPLIDFGEYSSNFTVISQKATKDTDTNEIVFEYEYEINDISANTETIDFSIDFEKNLDGNDLMMYYIEHNTNLRMLKTETLKDMPIRIDTINPTIDVQAEVENKTSSKRYSEGTEIIIIATSSEGIQATVAPELNVGFTESGLGKYNYQENENKGNAIHVDSNIKADGTTEWIYSYVIQAGDEGYLILECVSGSFTDLADNITDLKSEYATIEEIIISLENEEELTKKKILNQEFEKTICADTTGPMVKITNDLMKFVLKGDANKDNKVNIKDATIIQKYVANLVSEEDIDLEAADINGDNEVNIKDVTTIQKMIADIDVSEEIIIKEADSNEVYYRLDWNELIEGFDQDDIIVNGGEIKEFNVIEADKRYELIVTPTVENGNEGELQVIIPQNVCIDAIGHGNVASENIVKVDRKRPTVEIRANKEFISGKDIVTYEFLWSEAVLDFTVDNIKINNGIRKGLSGEGNYYILLVEPSNGNDLEVWVEENKCVDAVGNYNIQSSKHIIPVAPTVAITTDKGNPTNSGTIEYTFTWTEPVTEFDISDIILPNGIEGILSEDKTTLTVDYNGLVPEGNQGEVTIAVKENAVQDSNGNTNTYVSNTTRIDRKAPIVEIKANKNKVNGDERTVYEFLWSEAVSEFTIDDITVNNGTKGTLSGEGNYYTLEVTPTGTNDVEVWVNGEKCSDIAGNYNIPSSKHVIPVVPGLTITTDKGNPTNSGIIEYTFTWTEPVTGFDISDIILPNGIEGILSEDKTTLTVDYNGLVPEGNQGEVTIAVKENAVQDSNGNTNAYISNTTKIDRIAPIFISLEAYAESDISVNPSIDSVKQYYKAGDKIKVVATFSENISDKNPAPILKLEFSESGNANNDIMPNIEKKGNKIVYTYEIDDEDAGVLSVKGYTGEVEDIAGNKTVVSKRQLVGNTIIVDNVTPTLVNITVIAPNFEYDELLQDDETKRYGIESKTRNTNTIEIIAEYSEKIYNLISDPDTINQINRETAPVLKLKFGNGSERTVTYNRTEGNKIYYKYDIQSEDNGDLSIKSLSGNVCDIAGNTYQVNTTNPSFQKYEESILEENEITVITADTRKPEVTLSATAINYDDDKNVITGSRYYYREGAVITITAQVDEYVYKNNDKSLEVFTKDNAPELNVSFTTGGGEGTCTNVEYSDNKTIFTYTYEIKEEYNTNVNDDDNGTLILDFPASQCFDIALNGNLAGDEEVNNIIADTVKPTTNFPNELESEGYGVVDHKDRTWTVTFNEELYVYDPSAYAVRSKLSNSNKNLAPILLLYYQSTELRTEVTDVDSVNGKTVIKYRYSEDNAIEYDLNIGLKGFDFNNISDRAGNALELTDQTAPTLTSIKVTRPEDGTYPAGEVVTIEATFSEKLRETSPAPELKLEFSVSGDAKGNEGRASVVDIKGNKITYTYTITANDNKGNGDNGLLCIKSYAGTGLKDLAGNMWTGNTVALEGNITADTIAPVITKVEALADNEVIGKYIVETKEYVTGRTNADSIKYVITFSEDINLKDEDAIKLINAEKGTVTVNGNTITIEANTLTEGVQSLIVPSNIVEDGVGYLCGEYIRFNGITVDFTKPTVRFISEYNGGTYVVPTNIGKVEIRPNVEISEDIANIEYKWDNDEDYVEIENYSEPSDIAVPTRAFTQAGTYVLHIRVIDLAGNVTETSKTYKVENQFIGIELSTEEYTNQDIIATVLFGENLTDNRKVRFKAEGSNEIITLNAKGVAENGGINYEIETNGTIYAEATDRVGNKVYRELPVSNIDKETPEVNIELNGAKLIMGPNQGVAKIATKVEITDNKNIKEKKYKFLCEDINVSEMTEEQKAEIKDKITNTLTDEAKTETGEPGTWYLYVIAVDEAGNETIVKSNPFIVIDVVTCKEDDEETKKLVSELIIFEQIKEDIRDKAYIYVTYDTSIIKEATVTLDDEDYGFIDGNYGEIYKGDNVELYGNTTIKVEAWDACGNEIEHEYEVTDIEGPEFTISGNPENWTNSDVELTVYSDTKLTELTLNGENKLGDNKHQVKIPITEYGNYTFIAKDIYGNTSEKNIEVQIDKSLPEITDVKVENGQIEITANDIDKTLNRELSGVAQYAITDTTEEPVEWSTSNIIKTTKDETFFVWAKDKAGNIYMREEVVIKDTTAPKLIITTSLELNKWTNENINVIVEANEELASLVVKYTENGEPKEENILETKTYAITSNGTYKFVATDNAGNESEEEIVVGKIDKTAPVINAQETVVNGKDITIVATDELSEIKEYAISTTTELPVEWSKSNTVKTTEDGTFYVWVKDNAGNTSRSENSITVDTTAPELTTTTDVKLDKWTNTDIKVEVKSNEELASLVVKYTENEEPKEENILETKTYAITSNGTYKFVATDNAGNESEEEIVVGKIDKTAPVINAQETVVNGKDITIVATDELSEIKEYAISTTTELPVEWSKSNTVKTTEDGTFYVWVKDNAGNTSRIENPIVVDTTAPVITFTYGSLTVLEGEEIVTNISTNEDAIISYSWDNKNWINSEEYVSSLRVSKESVALGKYTLYVKAKDNVGNTSKVQTLEFNVIEAIVDTKVPEIIFEDLPTIQVDEVKYVKVAADMTSENITAKMNKEALLGKTPEYTKLTEDKKLRTGSEITIDGKTKYIIVVNGDVNCDGKVEAIDVTYANRVRLSKINSDIVQKLAADFDLNGKIEALDITMINRYRLGKIKGI